MIDNELTEVITGLDIASYLDREGIDYKETHGSSGDQLNVKTCPKCGESKWKVFLNAESGLGNCFSGDCEEKFNKWKFIQSHTGLGGRALVDHIKSVASEMGWRPARKAKVAVSIDVTGLKLPSSYSLPIHGRNLVYLENRGISIDIAEYFHLRYCKTGLFVYEVDGAKRFMNFDQRIIIPIFDIDGTLVSFQGRDITGTSEKKYLFPPGFASTGEHLYNAQNVHSTERVVIGEGVFDVAALKIALDGDVSLRDVVPIGSFGKHIADGQMSKLLVLQARGVKEITFMWDGELRAVDDAIETGIRVKGMGFKVRIALLPKGKDPNEVSADVVRQTYYGARELTPSSAIKLKLKSRAA